MSKSGFNNYQNILLQTIMLDPILVKSSVYMAIVCSENHSYERRSHLNILHQSEKEVNILWFIL